MKKFTLIGWAGFVTMFILFLLQRNCGNNHVCETQETKIIVEEKWDTIPKEIPVLKPYPVAGKQVIVEVPSKVDTALILKDYYTKFYYEQSIADTNISAIVKDTVYENKIVSRKFEYSLLKPFITNIIINNPTPKPQAEFFMGGFSSGTIKGGDIGIGFSAALKTKKNILYDLGYDVINNRVSFGVLVKLSRKKNG